MTVRGRSGGYEEPGRARVRGGTAGKGPLRDSPWRSRPTRAFRQGGREPPLLGPGKGARGSERSAQRAAGTTRPRERTRGPRATVNDRADGTPITRLGRMNRGIWQGSRSHLDVHHQSRGRGLDLCVGTNARAAHGTRRGARADPPWTAATVGTEDAHRLRGRQRTRRGLPRPAPARREGTCWRHSAEPSLV